ncbi:MAG: hypothetical protein ABF542_07495 [Gluconobacter sp.]
MKQSDWKPIASAPEDTPVLIYDEYYGICIGVRKSDENAWREDGAVIRRGERKSRDIQPLFWQALPIPPESAIIL